jgi:muconate cycloisomerase
MKITRVETMTVSVPIHPGSWHSAEYEPEGYTSGGTWVRHHWPDVPTVLMRVHTDEGLVGLGEVWRGVPAAQVLEMAPLFEGRDLWEFNLQELPINTGWLGNPGVYVGYEMALFDLAGKALGLPVYRLLGGKYRDRVPVSRCSGRMNPEDAARTAREAVARGYSVLKMKATADDPLVERLGAIQDATGDALKVVIDPNERFGQPYQLFAIDVRLRAAGITIVQCYESPYNQGNLDWYVLARQKLETPIALHMGDAGPVMEAIKREACDWLNIGGQIVETRKVAALAEAAGIPTWHGSGVGFGISEAAYTHIAASCRSMTLTSDICGELLRVDDLIREPLAIADGHVRVPEVPGLGVEIDDDAVDRYRVG